MFSRSGDGDGDGAGAQTKLRMLRQGSAALVDRSVHLYLRMYVLLGLCEERSLQCLPKLRRRIRSSPHPTEAITPTDATLATG